MIRLLVLLRSGPVSPERLATAMLWTSTQVEKFLQLSGLVIDDGGNIEIGAFAGCALDTLLAPLLTGRPTRVVSTCPATGRQIRLTVTEQGIREPSPKRCSALAPP